MRGAIGDIQSSIRHNGGEQPGQYLPDTDWMFLFDIRHVCFFSVSCFLLRKLQEMLKDHYDIYLGTKLGIAWR
jgi:hypothetical protein